MTMNDIDFLMHIRTQYPDLLDPKWTDEEFQYFLAIGPGWQSLVIEYCDRMQTCLRDHDLVGKFFVRQIKEKLGELRIYKRPVEPVIGIDEEGRDIYRKVTTTPEADQAMANIATDIAERALLTCEECAEPGQWTNIDGYFLTRCDTHLDEYRNRRGV